jgi:hypothetical protein
MIVLLIVPLIIITTTNGGNGHNNLRADTFCWFKTNGCPFGSPDVLNQQMQDEEIHMLNKFQRGLRRGLRTTSSIMLMLMIGYGIVVDTLHNYSYEVLDPIGLVIRLTFCGCFLAVGIFYNNKFRKRDEESKRIWDCYQAAQGDITSMKYKEDLNDSENIKT